MKRQVSPPRLSRSDPAIILWLLPLCLTALILASCGALAESLDDCYTIVAGRDATVGGGVFCGHNEDNGREDPAGLVVAPRRAHAPDEWIVFPHGARIPQADTTWAYWCLRMPGLEHSDAYLNEHGVAIVSNSCASREDTPELAEGGVGGAVLRRVVAERVCTARQGVHLVGRLIERFGYAASGRTLVICDPNEGWLVAMVNGKHWAAQRVPDDQVALLANTYSIRTMDLADTLHFLACPDLVAYAVTRGWHDPDREAFSFEAAYADRERREHPGNTHRQWSGLRRLAADYVPLPTHQRLPFCVRPGERLDLSAVTAVLRDHYEDSPYDEVGPRGDAHAQRITTICSPRTNSSSVFQLRADQPPPLAAVWWLALWQPCTSVYLPFYPGSGAPPEAMLLGSGAALQDQSFGPEAAEAYVVFGRLARWAAVDLAERRRTVAAVWSEVETECFDRQLELEVRLAAGRDASDPRAWSLPARHSQSVLDACLQRAAATVH